MSLALRRQTEVGLAWYLATQTDLKNYFASHGLQVNPAHEWRAQSFPSILVTAVSAKESNGLEGCNTGIKDVALKIEMALSGYDDLETQASGEEAPLPIEDGVTMTWAEIIEEALADVPAIIGALNTVTTPGRPVTDFHLYDINPEGETTTWDSFDHVVPESTYTVTVGDHPDPAH